MTKLYYLYKKCYIAIEILMSEKKSINLREIAIFVFKKPFVIYQMYDLKFYKK